MHRSLVIDVFLREKKLHLATLAEKSIMLGRGEMSGTVTRETERGGPCRPIETEVNRDSGSTYDRVSFLGYVPP
jgi:hypothetical protein